MARTPLRDGWRVLMRAPASVLAEIAWRWTFGVALWAVLYYSFREYFATVEISPAEYTLLRSLQPMTWLAITARVMVALVTGLRVVGPVIIPALSILWITLASIGRAATVRALSGFEPRTDWLSTAGLHAFRIALGFGAFFAFFGCGILIDTLIGNPAEHFAVVFLLSTIVLIVIGTLWTIINWFFSLAAIFTVRDHAGFVRSIREAVGLYQRESDPFVSSGFGFGVIRSLLVIAVTFVSLLIVSRYGGTHLRGTVLLVIAVSLPYFAIADAVNIWRLAAYISFSEPEPAPPVVAAPPPPPPPWEPASDGHSASEPWISPEQPTQATSSDERTSQ